MNREETDGNKNADDNKDGSFGLGSSGNDTPLFISMVKAEIDDIQPEFRLECVTCGEIFNNRDDIDFHATSCQIIEDGVMTTSQVARSDSSFILKTKECHESISGTTENTVEMSRTSLISPNNKSISSGLELDREGEGNGVVHNLSMECSKATTDKVTTPSHVPYQTSYVIENIDGKVLGVVVDDKLVADGIPLPAKENASFHVEMDDIKPEYWLECVTCGKSFTHRDDFDFHDATSCQMIEDDVISTSEVARSDSGFPLNNDEECHESTSGRAENTVEMSRTSLSFPNNQSILSGLELDKEGNGVIHNLPIECTKTTTENVTTPSHVPYQTSYVIENIDGKVLGDAVDDEEVADGIPLSPKENENAFLEIKLSRKLSWIPCHSCGTFLPNLAKLEYHIACRHYSPKIFDDTFDDRHQSGEEKEVEESDAQFELEGKKLIQPDVRMTRLFQCEACHDFALSEDDLLRHLCRSNPKGQEDSKSLEEDEDEDWVGASNFGVSKDELIRETEKDADQSLIDKDVLNDPDDFDLDKGEQEICVARSRPGLTTQKSQKTNANCFNRKTRGKRVMSAVQKEINSISRKSERLRTRLGQSEKGQISIGTMEQESYSENMRPSSLNRKSREKLVLMPKRNEGNSYDCKDDTNVAENRSSSQIRKSKRERKLGSDSATSIKIKPQESRSRRSNEGVSKLSSKNGNQLCSPASSGTRPNEKYKHQCTECFKWFQGKSKLQNHIRSHTGEKPFECTICFRKFTEKSNLKHHQRVHNGIKPFKCTICFRKFTEKSNLKLHQRVHDGIKPFECDICRRHFSQKAHLERHRELHTDQRPFKCSSCPKAFRSKDGLRSHQLTHLTERPFKCDVCSKAYLRKQRLIEHKYIHTGERPHICDVCSKGFRSKSDLSHHKKQHSATKRFKCDVCSKTFKLEKYLRRHKNTHSSLKSFKCDNCQNFFKSAQNLYYHRKKQCVGHGKQKFEEPISSSSSCN